MDSATSDSGGFSTRDKVKETVFVVIYILLIVILSLYLVPGLWWLWVLFIAAGLFVLMNWHSRAVAYRCPKCGKVHRIPWYVNLVTPRGRSPHPWKYLKCPGCHVWSRHAAVDEDEPPDAG